MLTKEKVRSDAFLVLIVDKFDRFCEFLLNVVSFAGSGRPTGLFATTFARVPDNYL